MGAWIEILDKACKVADATSHPTMGAWIEITYALFFYAVFLGSHPTMGAWIEISNPISGWGWSKVAPHDGCVD